MTSNSCRASIEPDLGRTGGTGLSGAGGRRVSTGEITFRHGISCRYIGQLSNWEVPVEVGRADTLEDLDKIIHAFEENYTNIYPSGARYPEAGYQITEIYVGRLRKNQNR